MTDSTAGTPDEAYEPPAVIDLGTLAKMTLGLGGSLTDSINGEVASS